MTGADWKRVAGYGVLLAAGVPPEVEELLDDPAHAERLGADLPGELTRAGAGGRVLGDELGAAEDDAERGAELVGDPGRERAEHVEAALVAELLDPRHREAAGPRGNRHQARMPPAERQPLACDTVRS